MNRRELIVAIVALTIIIPIQAFAGNVTWQSSADYLVTTNDPWATKQWEPHLAVRCCSSTNANTLVAGNIDNFDHSCQFYRSTDGGQTWSHKGNMLKSNGLDWMADPVVTSPNNAYFYYACLEVPTPWSGSTVYYIRVARSTDGGNTWPTQQVAVGGTENLIDKPWIASDANSGSTYKNNVYLCWTDFTEQSIKFKRYVPFDTDAQAKTLATGQVHGCNIAVGPQGQIYVAYMRDNTRTIELRRNHFGGDPNQWNTNTYTVGTWGRFTNFCTIGGYTYECLNGFNGSKFRVNHFPSIAVDSNAVVHVAWTSYDGTGTLGNTWYTNATTCKQNTDSCNDLGTAESQQ